MGKLIQRSLTDRQITFLASVNHDYQPPVDQVGLLGELAEHAGKNQKNGGILKEYFKDLNEKLVAIYDDSAEGENGRFMAVDSINCLSTRRLDDALSAVEEVMLERSSRVDEGIRRIREGLSPNFS